MSKAICSLLLLTIPRAPVSAYQFYEERGGWDIASGENACGMTMEYEGPGSTQVLFAKRTDGGIVLAVMNTAWTAKADEEYDVTYVLNGQEWGGTKSIGYVNALHRGFRALFNDKFEKDFASGSTLHVYLGDTQIDQLSLDGTTIALSSVNRCLKGLKAEIAAAEREKARWEHLPKDPFTASGAKASAGSLAGPPKPVGNLNRWFSYPPAAIREGREGTTEFMLAIGSDGVVRSCRVTQSSGHDILDAHTCTTAMRYARFSPGHDERGDAIEGTWSSRAVWKLSEPEPPPPPPITCVAGQVCTRE